VTKGLWTISCYEDGDCGEALEATRETALLTPLFSRTICRLIVHGYQVPLIKEKSVERTSNIRVLGIRLRNEVKNRTSRNFTFVEVVGGGLKKTMIVTLTQYNRAVGINNVPDAEKFENNISATLTETKHTVSMPDLGAFTIKPLPRKKQQNLTTQWFIIIHNISHLLETGIRLYFSQINSV
jgi:hypothetical protein